jgi:nucleoside-diphosphate-sugar epimerase
MDILVTGAAGFIGSHLCERLTESGHTVRGVDCLTPYYTPALKALNVEHIQAAGVSFLPLDLASGDLRPAVEGVEVIFHAAAQPGISARVSFDTYVRNNLLATHRLLQAAQNVPALQGFVNVSTSSVYGADATGDESTEPRPTSYYGVTKLAAEQLVLAAGRERGLPACSLRLFSVYGPRERPEKLYPRLIGALLEDRVFPLYEGSEAHLRSYTYVGDIIDGMLAVLAHLKRAIGHIFNVGSEDAFTTGEGIATVEQIVGREARKSIRPPRPGDQLKTHANIAKARRLLDYHPTTTLREGLEREVAWYREHILGKIDLWPTEEREGV